MKMTNQQWKDFFTACYDVLGKGSVSARHSETWCGWTTYSRITTYTDYWSSGLPNIEDIVDGYIRDGGVWGQPFLFDEIAHIIIPREFMWEKPAPGYLSGTKTQDINTLSKRLTELGIEHNLSEHCLDIKLF